MFRRKDKGLLVVILKGIVCVSLEREMEEVGLSVISLDYGNFKLTNQVMRETLDLFFIVTSLAGPSTGIYWHTCC